MGWNGFGQSHSQSLVVGHLLIRILLAGVFRHGLVQGGFQSLQAGLESVEAVPFRRMGVEIEAMRVKRVRVRMRVRVRVRMRMSIGVGMMGMVRRTGNWSGSHRDGRRGHGRGDGGTGSDVGGVIHSTIRMQIGVVIHDEVGESLDLIRVWRISILGAASGYTSR